MADEREEKGYELLEHTADVLVKCRGATLEECFENAAVALFDQIADLSRVDPRRPCLFQVEGASREELLYAFLSELIFLFDAYGMLFRGFTVTFDEGVLRCRAEGEELDMEKHRPRGAVKAVTYHMLEVDEEEPSVTVLFDV